MMKRLNMAGDNVLSCEARIEKANQTALDLLEKLKEADAEIEELKGNVKRL